MAHEGLGRIDGDVFKAEGLTLPMADYVWAGQKGSGSATVGIRPEHVITGELAKSAPVRTTVHVDLVEPMGSDTLAYTQLAGLRFRVRMDGQATVNPGDTLEIGLDPSRMSLFDTATEARL